MNLKCERAALKHLEEGILILAALNLQTTWKRNLIIWSSVWKEPLVASVGDQPALPTREGLETQPETPILPKQVSSIVNSFLMPLW